MLALQRGTVGQAELVHQGGEKGLQEEEGEEGPVLVEGRQLRADSS